MNLITESYLTQAARWPRAGRQILAQYDEESVVLYQAYRPSIGRFAVSHGYFGGEFRFGRMSWIKPNFLWMMYRSGWGRKKDQEVILAIRIQRSAFELILHEGVPTSYDSRLYPDRNVWKKEVDRSSVLFQWDPDHDPLGVRQERRAIQLGLRGDFLTQYSRDWIIDIQDISDFVAEQRNNVNRGDLGSLITPEEVVYPIKDKNLAQKLGIDP